VENLDVQGRGEADALEGVGGCGNCSRENAAATMGASGGFFVYEGGSLKEVFQVEQDFINTRGEAFFSCREVFKCIGGGSGRGSKLVASNAFMGSREYFGKKTEVVLMIKDTVRGGEGRE